jgi:hypothetical protein
VATLVLCDFHHPATVADFDPETGELHHFRRIEDLLGAAGRTAPIVGQFSLVGSKSDRAAFYRTPAGDLELYIAGRRVQVGARTESAYEPPDPGRLPLRLRGTNRRYFRLVDRGRVLLEFEYKDESIWSRLFLAWDNAPNATPAYDLLFEVHRVLSSVGERDRVFR